MQAFTTPTEFVKLFLVGGSSASSSIKLHSIISITAAIY